MGYFTRPTIRAVLLAPMLALILVSTGSLFLMQWFAARDAVDELADRLVKTGLNLIEDELRERLDPTEALVVEIAREIGAGTYAMAGDPSLETFVSGSLAGAPHVAGVVILDTALKGLRVLRAGAARRVERTDFSSNPAAKDAMQATRDRTDVHWGPLIDMPRARATFLNALMPIRRGDTAIGLAAAFVSVEDLSRLAQHIGRQQQATAFVLSGEEQVIAHPLMLDAHLPADRAGRAWPVASFPDATLRAFAVAEKAAADWSGGVPPAGLTTFTHDRERYIAISEPIEGFGDAPLIIGAYRKASEVDQPFERLYLSGVAGLGILALAVLMTILLSRAISSPLRRAAGAAEAIGTLEVSDIRPMSRSAIREVDDLARAFNLMLDGLRAFGRYVPRALVGKLIQEGRVGAGTEERVLTVMFTDIRGFSSISEGLAPKEVADFVNRHLSLLAECIEAEGGTIDKFIGDAVMAFWGAPEHLADTAAPACRAALAIARRMEEENGARKLRGEAEVGVRIGLHTGALIVGDIGAPNRINYTVVGDAVNVAQRLEALGKEIDAGAQTVILLSGETRARLPEGFAATPAGEFAVKGRTGKVEVHRLR